MPATSEALQPATVSNWRRLIRRLFTPSLGDCFFLTVVVLLFSTSSDGWRQLLVDGDAGWHIRTGDWILQHHTVPYTDPFSFSKPGGSWYAWEWLADVIFAAAHARQGLRGVVVISGLTIAASILVLFRYLLWRGAGITLAVLLSVLTADASRLHYLARPHVFTLLLLPVCLWILDRDRERPWGGVWLLVPIAALWTNLHAGFVALFVSLGLYTAGAFVKGRWAAVRRPFLVSAACLLATLANPYGYLLHVHILQHLGSDWIARFVDEFQPPNIRFEGMYKYEAMLFAGIGLTILLVRRRKYEDALLMGFWAHESLQAARHVPLYMFAAAPIVGTELARIAEPYTGKWQRSSLLGTARDLAADFSPAARRNSIWLAVAAAIIWYLPAPGWPKDFPDIFPVAMVERQRALLAPAAGPPSRVLSSDQWGGYLIYKLYPSIHVFADGRFDYYGDDLGNEHLCLMSGCERWRELMEKWNFNIALLPRNWPLIDLLKSLPQWRVIDQDKTAILLRKSTD